MKNVSRAPKDTAGGVLSRRSLLRGAAAGAAFALAPTAGAVAPDPIREHRLFPYLDRSVTCGMGARNVLGVDGDRIPTLRETQALFEWLAFPLEVEKAPIPRTIGTFGRRGEPYRVLLPEDLPPQEEAEELVCMVGHALFTREYIEAHPVPLREELPPEREALRVRLLVRSHRERLLIASGFCAGWFGPEWLENRMGGDHAA